jgi:hypothetical protein
MRPISLYDGRNGAVTTMGRLSASVLPLLGLVVTPFLSNDLLFIPEKKHLTVLKEIHAQVKEMGLYPGQDFFQQAFFVGEDDDDTNKDIHVSILIRAQEQRERMAIRVTWMKKDRRNPQARLAGTTKELTCLIGEDGVEIQSSDYTEKEIAALAPEILKAILDKKRLLKFSSIGDSILCPPFFH